MKPLILFLALLTLSPLAHAQNSDEVVAEVYGEKITRTGSGDQRGPIFSALLRHYAEQQKITVTDDEIATFVSHLNRAQEDLATNNQRELAEIEKQLANPALSSQQKTTLESQKQTLEKFQQSQQQLKSTPPAEADEFQAAQRRIAREFVGRWKVSKALYDQYGGRIIFQQAGPEPIDAYRDFLKAEQQSGNFKILDPKVEADFWRYFTDDKMHVFSQDTTVFTTPWWTKKVAPQ